MKTFKAPTEDEVAKRVVLVPFVSEYETDTIKKILFVDVMCGR
jgi:hypothetical protein